MSIDTDPDLNAEQFLLPETLAPKPVETLALGSLLIGEQMGWITPDNSLWTSCASAFRKASQGEKLGDEEHRLVTAVNELTRAYTRYYLYGVRAKYDIKPTGDDEIDVVKGLSEEEVALIQKADGETTNSFVVNRGDDLLRNMTIVKSIQGKPAEKRSDPTGANEYFNNLFLAKDEFLSGIVKNISELHEELKRLFPESSEAEVRRFAELYTLMATRVIVPPDEYSRWKDVRRILHGGMYYKGLYSEASGETIDLVPSSQKRALEELSLQDRNLVRYLLEMNKYQSEATFLTNVTEHLYDLYDDSTIKPELVPLPREEGQVSTWEEKLKVSAAIRRDMDEGPNSGHPSHIFGGGGKKLGDDAVGHLPGDRDYLEDPYYGDIGWGSNPPPKEKPNTIQIDPGEIPPKDGEVDDGNPFKDFVNDLPPDSE